MRSQGFTIFSAIKLNVYYVGKWSFKSNINFYQLKNFHLQSCGVGAGGSRDERRDAVFVVWIGFQSPSVDFVKAFTRKS